MSVGERKFPNLTQGYTPYLVTDENTVNGLKEVGIVVIGPSGAPVSVTGTVVSRTGQYTDESGNVLTVKRAKANVEQSQSDSSIVASVASKKIRVLWAAFLAGTTATEITLQSNSTAISPLFANAANGGAVLPYNPFGWFETVAGEALKATTSAGSTTSIAIGYVEV